MGGQAMTERSQFNGRPMADISSPAGHTPLGPVVPISGSSRPMPRGIPSGQGPMGGRAKNGAVQPSRPLMAVSSSRPAQSRLQWPIGISIS